MVKMEIETTQELREKISTSVLRTSEIFALTKHSNLNGYNYAPTYALLLSIDLTIILIIFDTLSKKIRVCTKLNDKYLHLPTQLIKDDDTFANTWGNQVTNKLVSDSQPSSAVTNDGRRLNSQLWEAP